MSKWRMLILAAGCTGAGWLWGQDTLPQASRSLAEWRQFRGADSAGVIQSGRLPVRLDPEKHIAWKIALPGRGVSSPIVVGSRVFLSCASGTKQDRLHIRCHSAREGTLLWERQFWATGRTMCHKKTSVAAPTPASDGKQIYVLFSSNDVFCLGLDGQLQWLRGLTVDYPNASNSLGMASSPIVAGNTLIIQSENDSESFAIGLDVENGKNRWRLNRPKAANWTSPVMLPDGAERKLVVLQSSKGVAALDPATGETVWNYSEGAATIPSSVVAGNLLLVPSRGITALQPRSTSAEPEILWRSSWLRPSTPSPVVLGNRIFTINQAGVLTCGSLRDGSRKWQLRLKGPFSSTPVGWGEYLYFVNESGLLQVVNTTPQDQGEGTVVSQMNLGETILCTPALDGDALYLRSDRHLWKIAAPEVR